MNIIVIKFILHSILFLAGASVFSFINVIIYRVPRNLPFGNERSICPNCNTVLKGYYMVPVLSYVLLGGKCAVCKKKISLRYPLIELMGGVLGIVTYFHVSQGQVTQWERIGRGGVIFAILAILTAISFIDLDTMEIPNGLVIAVLVCSVIGSVLFQEKSILERVIGMVSVSVPLLLITLVIPGAFGGGDIKLMAALGIFLGWKLSMIAFVSAVFLGGTYGAFLLITKKKGRKDHFAFGPFLCIGAAVSIFTEVQLLNWYLGFLGI